MNYALLVTALLLPSTLLFAQEDSPRGVLRAEEVPRVFTESGLSIRTDFPGGNLIVDEVQGDRVIIRPDLRGGRDWFYWSFECKTDNDRTLTFELPEKRTMKYIGMQGPAVSADHGRTWGWLGSDSVNGSTFTCTIEAKQPLRLSVTIPYMPDDLERMLADSRDNPHLKVTELARSRQQRPIKLLQVGSPGVERIPVLVTARHHACESMASFLLEGFIRAALSDTDAGRQFRERYVLYAVPIVDVDGVVRGDQGKNRNPHDHNRDYTDTPKYPAVAAIQSLRKTRGIQVAVDFHCPTLWMDYHQVIYFVGPRDTPSTNYANVSLLAGLLKDELPATAPRGCLVLLKNARPQGMFADYYSAGERTMMATTLEFPYASPGKQMTPAACVDYGQLLLKAWNKARFTRPDE